MSLPKEKFPLKKKGTFVLSCSMNGFMQVEQMNRNRVGINGPGTYSSKTLYILYGLYKNQQVLLMQCTVYLL